MERNDDGTASIDCKMEEANNLESTNVDEDCLEEKKEIFVNESRLLPPSSSSSSSANTTDCKTMSNRIVVSNAQISNNSVTVSVIYPENNNAYLPTSTVEGTLEVHSKCGGTMSARRTGIHIGPHQMMFYKQSNLSNFSKISPFYNITISLKI